MSSSSLIVGTGANDATVGAQAWQNTGNITAADSNNANVQMGASLGNMTDNSVKIVKNGTISGTDQSAGQTWSGPGVFRVDSFGGSSNLWGLSWTASDINSGNMGVVLSCNCVANSTTSNYLKGTMSGNVFSIPAGATINGIQVNINRAGNCFAAGTLVETLLGPRKIETLRTGDIVLSWTQEGVFADLVQGVISSEAPSQVRVRTAHREVLCTASHPFETARGRVTAGELRAGDLAFTINFNHVAMEPVVGVEELPIAATVYNLKVADRHTYFANGFAVHNKSNASALVDYMQLVVTYTAGGRRRVASYFF